MRLAGSSEADVAGARRSPLWPALEELAPTLAHDAAVIGDGPVLAARFGGVAQPVLVLTGGGIAGLPGFFDAAAAALAPVLTRFFSEWSRSA